VLYLIIFPNVLLTARCWLFIKAETCSRHSNA